MATKPHATGPPRLSEKMLGDLDHSQVLTLRSGDFTMARIHPSQLPWGKKYCGICSKNFTAKNPMATNADGFNYEKDGEYPAIMPCGHVLGHHCAEMMLQNRNTAGQAHCDLCKELLVVSTTPVPVFSANRKVNIVYVPSTGSNAGSSVASPSNNVSTVNTPASDHGDQQQPRLPSLNGLLVNTQTPAAETLYHAEINDANWAGPPYSEKVPAHRDPRTAPYGPTAFHPTIGGKQYDLAPLAPLPSQKNDYVFNMATGALPPPISNEAYYPRPTPVSPVPTSAPVSSPWTPIYGPERPSSTQNDTDASFMRRDEAEIEEMDEGETTDEEDWKEMYGQYTDKIYGEEMEWEGEFGEEFEKGDVFEGEVEKRETERGDDEEVWTEQQQAAQYSEEDIEAANILMDMRYGRGRGRN